METPASRPAGFLASLRSLGEGLLLTVQERFELFTVELHEEKFRLIQTFVWISAALFAGMMMVTFASITLVYCFWESARLLVLGGLAAFYAVALVTIMLALRRHLRRQPRPFAGSLQALQGDRACIRNES